MTNAEKFQEIFKEFATEVWAFPEKDFLTWLNAEYEEPTTKNDLALIHTEGLDEEIRCTMCTNSMKSDRGCDGSCVVNNDMYKAVMDAIEKRIQLITKNNLGVDCISRQAVIDAIMANCIWENEYNLTSSRIKKAVENLPLITPQEPTIKVLGEELRKARKGIADEKVLIGYNMAVAICNKHLGESEVKDGNDD